MNDQRARRTRELIQARAHRNRPRVAVRIPGANVREQLAKWPVARVEQLKFFGRLGQMHGQGHAVALAERDEGCEQFGTHGVGRVGTQPGAQCGRRI